MNSLHSSGRIADVFDAWWRESFPMAPPNAQARANFIAFGVHVERLVYADLFSDHSDAS